MTHTITCPSGLTGVLRGMKVREERVLAEQRETKMRDKKGSDMKPIESTNKQPQTESHWWLGWKNHLILSRCSIGSMSA